MASNRLDSMTLQSNHAAKQPLWTGNLLIAAVLAAIVSYIFIDHSLTRWADGVIDGSSDQFFQIVTRMGLSEWYLVPSAVLLIVFKLVTKSPAMAWRSALVFCAIGGSGLFVNLLKFIFGRYRPPMLLNDGIYGFKFFELGYMQNSFPSGHSATAGSLIVLACVFMPKVKPLWIALGILIASSRMFLCVHYLSDVIMGIAIGIIFTIWTCYFFSKLQIKPVLDIESI